MRFEKISFQRLILIVATVFSISFIITYTTSASAGSEQEGTAEIKLDRGKPAPDFTLKNLLGDDVSLNDFKGNILVLAFGFSKQTAKDPGQYRSRISSDFKDRGVKSLKLIHI